QQNPQVRSERTLPVRLGHWGCPGRRRRPTGTIQRPPSAHNRPGWQPVHGRSFRWPRDEVPAEAGRRPRACRWPGAAVRAHSLELIESFDWRAVLFSGRRALLLITKSRRTTKIMKHHFVQEPFGFFVALRGLREEGNGVRDL